jgi:G3E family GTPase
VAQTFFLDDFVQSRLRLDAVVSVCDCRRVLQLMDRGAGADKELGVINEQFAMADVILLNKLEGLNLSSPNIATPLAHANQVGWERSLHLTRNTPPQGWI